MCLSPKSPFSLEGAGGEFGNKLHQDVSLYFWKIKGVFSFFGVKYVVRHAWQLWADHLWKLVEEELGEESLCSS